MRRQICACGPGIWCTAGARGCLLHVKISQDAIANAHDAVLAATGRTGLFLDSFASVCGGLWRAGVNLDASPEVLTEVGVAAAAQWVAKGVTFESSREEQLR